MLGLKLGSTKWANLYPFSDQNGAKPYPLGPAHTYMVYILREYLPGVRTHTDSPHLPLYHVFSGNLPESATRLTKFIFTSSRTLSVLLALLCTCGNSGNDCIVLINKVNLYHTASRPARSITTTVPYAQSFNINVASIYSGRHRNNPSLPLYAFVIDTKNKALPSR